VAVSHAPNRAAVEPLLAGYNQPLAPKVGRNGALTNKFDEGS
jgi:hypothetical protein